MNMTIGEQVTVWRKRAGLEQSELAAKAKLARNTIVDIEGDKGNPNLGTLRAIAKALKLEVRVTFEEKL